MFWPRIAGLTAATNPQPPTFEEVQYATNTLAALHEELLQLQAENSEGTLEQARDAFERWSRQHTTAFESLRPLLDKIAAAAERKIALAPVPPIPVPLDATPEAAECADQENTLTEALAVLRRDGMNSSPERRQVLAQKWQEANSAWLEKHRRLLERNDAEAARVEHGGNLVIELPPNATDQERKFWRDEAAITEALLELRRKYLKRPADEHLEAARVWFGKNAVFLGGHEQLRRSLK